MKLSCADTEELVRNMIRSGRTDLSVDPQARTPQWTDDHERHLLRLAPVFSITALIDLIQNRCDFDQASMTPQSFTVILIRAGSASMGYFEDGELVAHKVIRKYMVRQSQGRMQLAYLNSKGKSRAGSRVRLRESVEFFEEINEKLGHWFEEFGPPTRIFHSCPVRLWSYWFASRVEPPFSQEDLRLQKIPLHVHQPDHDELLRISGILLTSELVSVENAEPLNQSPKKT